MSNYNSLKATINANIKTNGNQEITGSVLNSVLNAMVNALGAGYLYAGIATPSTNPSTPDQKEFYIATTPGTYTNFGGLTIAEGEVAFLRYDSSWHKDVTGFATKDEIDGLDIKLDKEIQINSAADAVTSTKEEIDFDDYPLRDYWITDANKYGTSATYKHILVPVCPGDVFLVTANSTNTATLAWMASKKVPSSGGTPAFAPGTTKITIPAGETRKMVAPSGALYLYVYRGAGDAYTSTPESLFRISNLLNDEIFTETETIKTKTILRDENQNILLVNVSNGGLIQSSSTSGDRGYYIPVQAGQKVRIQANTSTQHYIKYGFCASVPEVGTQLTNYYVSPKISSIDDTMEVLYDGYFFCYRNTGYFTQLFQFSIIETENAWDGKADKATTLEGYGITDAYTKTEVNDLRNSFALTENVPGNGNDFAYSPYIADVIPGNTYRVYVKNTDVSMDGVSVPNDRYRFAIYFYDSNKSNSVRVTGTLVNKPLKESYDVVAPSGSAYMRVGIRCSASDSLQMIFKDVTAEGVSSLAGILDANPDSEFIPKMMSAKKRYFTSTNNENPTPYVIAHLSDIHGNWDNVSRFLEWCNHYSDKIDLLVNSGDTMENTFNSNISGYDAIEGVDNILVVIGNHDTRSSVDTSQWQAHVGLDAYNKFIAPHISSWGVTQPSNAATEGKCYYYKDDATRKLRIICVDIMGYDSTQDSWVQGLLADALTNEYHVLIVTHFIPARSYAERDEPSHEVIECNYSSLYPSGSDSSNLTAYNTNSYLLGASVDTFIQGGGLFVGYLGGHYHREIVAKHAKYPEQLFFAVGASKAGEMRDYNHVVGTRDRDEFEIVSIDTYTKTITLYKVGANVDKYGRHKNSICINYETATIKAEAF